MTCKAIYTGFNHISHRPLSSKTLPVKPTLLSSGLKTHVISDVPKFLIQNFVASYLPASRAPERDLFARLTTRLKDRSSTLSRLSFVENLYPSKDTLFSSSSKGLEHPSKIKKQLNTDVILAQGLIQKNSLAVKFIVPQPLYFGQIADPLYDLQFHLENFLLNLVLARLQHHQEHR